MGGYLLLAAYLACGVALMDGLRPAGARLTRLWLGLCAGLILMMWLPALFAFFVGFTRVANLLGLGVAALISAVASFLTRHARRRRRFADMPLWLPLALVIPMALVSGWLQYSHVLRNVDGALHVGQSTYGDLCLHLGIATSLRNAAFPPHYSLLPGALLGYPFLGDSMVTSMLLFGSGLAPAFAVTGTLMMALVYLGFVILCWELTRSRAATVIAFSLMFLTVAAIAMPRRGCCTLMSGVQSLLAISLGRMGSMGLLSPIGYILPGIAMDAMLLLAPKLRLSPAETAVLVNLTGSVSASLAANIIVFRLHGAPLALYASISAVSGAIFGLTSVQIVRLLRKAILLR